MKLYRASGILMHPTSIPNRYGIGDFGSDTYKFVNFLHETKQKIWQILPLGTVGYGNSPYQSYSAFAGNYYLISPEMLCEEGLLSKNDLEGVPDFPLDHVDFEKACRFKSDILSKAFNNFKTSKNDKLRKEFAAFCREKKWWLDDFALFMAVREKNREKPFYEWSNKDIIKRKKEAMEKAREELSDSIEMHRFMQFIFFKQWLAVKAYANKKGIKIMGDVPIYISHNSVDVWTCPQYFKVDDSGHLLALSGVPPDYYCATGQLWGNPIYRWDVMHKEHYKWWVDRIKDTMELVDMVRLDHFRGFDAFWEVPAGETTAINGKWEKCPGEELFNAFKKEFGNIPIIAEDLGVITPEVNMLRDKFNLPGMLVLQFAFESDYNQMAFDEFDPANFPRHSVVYTGTHDNNTTVGWFNEKPGEATTMSADSMKLKVNRILGYFKTDGSQINWDMIQDSMRAKSDFSITPMQDVLGLGSEARMNKPGTASGNWGWRMTWSQITPEIKKKLKDLTVKCKRD